MCAIFFAYDVHPLHPLVLLANRDEFYDRETAPAAVWDDCTDVFGGRDLVGGGTWLGIARRSGRVAAVTNYREPSAQKGTVSRGHLVADFLKTDQPAPDYLGDVHNSREDYSGFNLLVGEFSSAGRVLFYYSNREGHIRPVEPGVYGLSNHLLNTPWPKVRKGTRELTQLISLPVLEKESLFNLLADESQAADRELPDTGVGYQIEKALSAIFIRTSVYGTRCSTLVTVSNDLDLELDERVFV